MLVPLRAYLELTKPGITLFVALSAAAGFITAQRGLGDVATMATMVMATIVMSGGAAALNHAAEYERDSLMRRTARRPVASGVISPMRASWFGWTLSLAGLVLSLTLLPLPATTFLVLSHVSYVFVYTPLKGRTPLCTLAGAIPGALPVLAGCAATGRPIDLAGAALASVLFMWQIPHFLAIGWLGRDDYARAGCPMLGVVDPSGHLSARVALAYAFVMLVSSAVVGLNAPVGALYIVAAAATSGAYLLSAWRFARNPDPAPARQLFFSSLLVLPLLLGALIVDLLL